MGRPKKKEYDAHKQLADLMAKVDFAYEQTGEIKATAVKLDMKPEKVKKLLITSGKIEYEETAMIQRLLAYGRKMPEIEQELGIKKSAINSYLPYTKVPYNTEEVSANADRCRRYRLRCGGSDRLQ